ncbi:ribonuclease HII [Flavobacteriales bacterium]|jgi:ribonuclease HII|nr:ribonuclease HII [Flavobacteriales bacterium]MBT4881838.1 ribonuclease HII [Flavobacteriales bacterium]MDC3305468.1 ribonuclease HII [Flavobacteriales bacterium]MDC3394835.1 ribonuclease HII [Flavobacteriales bacterium]MDG1348818.1 ribonuclease HII [Flavobacteriales bacterium]
MLKHYKSKLIIAGCDEAGRGCLSGPVVAAAVILPKKFKNKILNDSKVLSEKKRELLRPIIEKEAIAWAVGIVSPSEIDEINILNASFLAMHRAIEGLNTKAELLLIDGNRFNTYPEIPHECIIKGDGKYLSIAAASVLAKTYRDDIMKELDTKFPAYNWKQNKGYPTKQHRKAIVEFGANNHHRKSFQLLPTQLVLNI